MAQDRTIKDWRREEWRDPLTGKLTQVEIIPENDLRNHISSEDCECIPELEEAYGVVSLTHNSFDGREMEEGHEAGH